MLCPVPLEILVKLSASCLFLPTKTSMGGKDNNPRELYTGQRVSAPPKVSSWAEELIINW